MASRDEAYWVRRTLVEGMWLDGWPSSDIADVLGWSRGSSISVLRTFGYEMPHRLDAERRQRLFEGRWLAA